MADDFEKAFREWLESEATEAPPARELPPMDMVLRVVRADTGEKVEVARVPLEEWGPDDGFELVATPRKVSDD